MNPILRKKLKALHEGERAYGAWHYDATAKHYHGVDNPDGAMEGMLSGQVFENTSSLLNHIHNVSNGRPVDVVVQDLLEAGKIKIKAMSPNERMLSNLSSASKLNIYRGKIK